MLTTVEGIYKEGKVELTEVPKDVQVARVLVTFLSGDRDAAAGADKAPKPGQMIYRGMFSGPIETNEEDFKMAEFHGDPDDGLVRSERQAPRPECKPRPLRRGQ
ncbi:MAG: hypothetical protein JO250_00875 [Armatimonadetes bacterium]|nr:hypothetical protein [Armatimonadota bacterium]